MLVPGRIVLFVSLLLWIVVVVSACGHAIEDVSEVDNLPPTTSISPSQHFFNQAQTVTLSCSDTRSGCASTYYTLDKNAKDFIQYTAPFTVTNTSSVFYYSTDKDGNVEQTHLHSFFIDTQQPQVNPQLEFSNITPASITVAWAQASDGSGSNLEYKLYYSSEPNISTLDEVQANGVVAMEFTSEIFTMTINNLDSAHSYYWNVLVQDLAGNVAPYAQAYQATQAAGILNKVVLPFGSDPGIARYVGMDTNNNIIFGGLKFNTQTGVIQDFGGVGNDIVFDDSGGFYTTYTGGSSPTQMLVSRYKVDTGLLDTKFGSSGTFAYANAAGATTDGYDEGRAMVIDNNGNIVVVGDSASDTDFNVVVWRVKPSGILDDTFGNGGYTVITDTAGIGYDVGRAIVLDSSGNIWLSGESYNGLDYDMVIWRLEKDGQFDPANGVGEQFIYSTLGDDRGFAITMDAGDKILVAGESWDDTIKSKDMTLWRYDPEVKSLDANFGVAGMVRKHNAAGGDGEDRGFALALDNLGKIVVSGTSWNANNNLDMVVWRFDNSGTPDPYFGTNGVVIHDNAAGGNGHDTGRAIAFDQSNTLYIAGGSYVGINDTNGNSTNDARTLWIYH